MSNFLKSPLLLDPSSQKITCDDKCTRARPRLKKAEERRDEKAKGDRESFVH